MTEYCIVSLSYLLCTTIFHVFSPQLSILAHRTKLFCSQFHFRFNPQFVTLNSDMKDWHHYFLQPIQGSHVITETVTVNISIHIFNRGQSLSSAAGTLWTHKHTHSIVLSKQLTHPVPPFPSYMAEFLPSISVSLSLTHRHLHSHAHTHRS